MKTKINIEALRVRATEAANLEREKHAASVALVVAMDRSNLNVWDPLHPAKLEIKIAKMAAIAARVAASQARSDLTAGLDAADLQDPELAAACEATRYRDDLSQMLEEKQRDLARLAATDVQIANRVASLRSAHAAWTAKRLAAGDPPPATLPNAPAPEALHMGAFVPPDAAGIVQALDRVIAAGGPRVQVDERVNELQRLADDIFETRAAIQKGIEARQAEEQAAREDAETRRRDAGADAAAHKAENKKLRERFVAEEIEQKRLVAAQMGQS